MKADYLISIKGLHKFFHGVHVLKGIDLNVKGGDLVSIIGRSGCGKTTLLRCLNCLEILDAGTIHIAGITLNRKDNNNKLNSAFSKVREDIRKTVRMPFQVTDPETDEQLDEEFRLKAHALRIRVGMLFQSLNLFPHLTVLDNVMIGPLIVKSEPKQEVQKKALQLLEKVGLQDFTKRYPHQLSGGQAQRVAIARALAMNPQVMLYDEPTSALDPELVNEVLEVMKNLHNEGMTQIVVTHAMGFARSASNMVVYMEEGNIVESGPPSKIFSNPDDERTRQYLKLLVE